MIILRSHTVQKTTSVKWLNQLFSITYNLRQLLRIVITGYGIISGALSTADGQPAAYVSVTEKTAYLLTAYWRRWRIIQRWKWVSLKHCLKKSARIE